MRISDHDRLTTSSGIGTAAEDPVRTTARPTFLHAGTIQPGVEVALWQYAFGTPKEIIESSQPVSVEIVHHYTGDPPKI